MSLSFHCNCLWSTLESALSLCHTYRSETQTSLLVSAFERLNLKLHFKNSCKVHLCDFENWSETQTSLLDLFCERISLKPLF